MDLTILSWNINFVHDNWYSRLININNIIKKESEKCHLISLQEATIPFTLKNNVYENFKNSTYQFHPLVERNYIYTYIKKHFPKYQMLFNNIFNFLMDKIFYIYGYIFSNYGEHFKNIYFNYPFVFSILILLFPFIAMGMVFIGMITITNNSIKGITKMKHIGHFAMMQYKEFKYNDKDIFYANIHLNPGDKDEKMYGENKRIIEINNVLDFIKKNNYKNIILVGDFNDTPESKVYNILHDNGFISVNKSVNKKEQITFPSKNKCIDYIWIKGDNIKIKNFEIFGNETDSDHKALKATLNIL